MDGLSPDYLESGGSWDPCVVNYSMSQRDIRTQYLPDSLLDFWLVVLMIHVIYDFL